MNTVSDTTSTSPAPTEADGRVDPESGVRPLQDTPSSAAPTAPSTGAEPPTSPTSSDAPVSTRSPNDIVVAAWVELTVSRCPHPSDIQLDLATCIAEGVASFPHDLEAAVQVALQEVADRFGDDEDLAGWVEELTRALHQTGALRADIESGGQVQSAGMASPTPSFDEIVGLGAWWLAQNKPHYSMCEGLPLASSAAEAVRTERDDVLAALQLALNDPEVFDGFLDDDEIRDLICAVHPAHKAADIPYQTAP